MTPDDIAALVTSGESETLEFKETTRTRREAAISVCAFQNQGDGRALFGGTPDDVALGSRSVSLPSRG